MHIARNIKAYTIIYIAAALTLLLSLAMSCNKVEYGYVDTGEEESSNPSISEVSFSFDWSKLDETGDLPNDLLVVMSRVVNTVHYVYSLDKDGMIQQEQVAATDTILNGDYYVLALAQKGSYYKYELDGVDQFVDSLNISMKHLYARIPEVPTDTLVEKKIMDFNPLYPFIYSAEPLYLEVKKQSIYPGKEANNVVLTPQLLTRTLTFKINVTVEEGVQIERLVGIISGVPSEIQLMSGIVSRYYTSKAFFEMTNEFNKDNNYIYAGDVNVLGLFPATKPGFITGPGILQIILDAKVANKNKRRFFASINLKETIEKADLMIETEDHQGYRSVKDAVLEVPASLIVSKDQILSGGGNGLEIWYDNEVDIEAEI